MGEFNWHGDDDADAVVLQYQPRTAVYRTKGGNVVIRQEKDAYEEFDPELFLTPQGALAVAYRLIEEAHLAGLPQPSLSLMTGPEMGIEQMTRQADAFPANPEAEHSPPLPEPGPLLAVMEAPANDIARRHQERRGSA